VTDGCELNDREAQDWIHAHPRRPIPRFQITGISDAATKA